MTKPTGPTIPMSFFKENPENPRTITEQDLQLLMNSIQAFPQMLEKRKIIIKSWDNPIPLGGNQRVKALIKLGYEAIPAEWVDSADGWTEQQCQEFIIRDNIDYGEWDIKKLTEGEWDISELKEWGLEIPDPQPVAKEIEEDEYLMPNEVTTTIKRGDIITIGQHRLMCGDSTSEADLTRLMEEHYNGTVPGRLADMVYTDPPYGVSYAGVPTSDQTFRFQMIENDELRGDSLVQFLAAAFSNMRNWSDTNAPAYVWYASRTHIEFESALKACGYTVKQQLIWNKGMVLGHADYHWAHEPLLYCRKDEGKPEWYGDRTHKTILGERRTDIAKLRKEEMIGILEALMKEQSVWEIDRDGFKSYQHPTQKPVALAARAIQNSSKPKDLILDLFGGSGATMVACEQLDRTCHMMEIGPAYCQVIINRMQQLKPDIEIKVNGEPYKAPEPASHEQHTDTNG